MDSPPSGQTRSQSPAPPEPETLRPRISEGSSAVAQPEPAQNPQQNAEKPRHRSYRPSHKATLIGLGVVMVILAVNAIALGFVLVRQSKNEDLFDKGQVSISTDDLNKLGINRDVIGDSGVELIVSPDAQFKGKISVAGDTTVSGQVFLNNKLTGTDATITQLQAGKTIFNELNVNGAGTLTTLNLREDLVVEGRTRLQGAVSISQLLTVNSSAGISGNLSVGGTLSVASFSAQAIRVSGHLLSSGPTPSVGPGSAIGSNGTVTVSGNDLAGTISINVGAGGSGGTLVNLAFRAQYGSAPRVVISPVGVGGSFYVTNTSVGGFSVGVNSGLSPGGYKINYIVVQ